MPRFYSDKLPFLLSILLLLLLMGCVTKSAPFLRINNPAALAGGDPILAFAAQVIDSVPDIYSANFLANRVAEEYVRENRPDLAREMEAREIALSKAPSVAANRFQLLIGIAKTCISTGDIPLARRLLQEALDQVIALESDDLKGAALQTIIEESFTIQDAFTDVLRDAIDYLYVLQDPAERVKRLTELGEKYQELNVRNRADSLVQQAIAAASAIINPWLRAEAYTLIAKRFKAENDPRNANVYYDLAVKDLQSVHVFALSASDAQVVLRLVVNLAEAGRFVEAGATINLLPTESLRVNAQLAIIERSVNQKSALQARLQVQRLLNQLARQDPDNQSELSLSTLLRLAEIYQTAGLITESLTYAQSAMPYLASPRIAEISGYRSRLALVFARDGRFEDAIAGAGLITDAFVGSQTLRQIAELLAARSPNAKGNARSWGVLLQEAERQAGESNYLRETAFADVASSAFKLGDDVRGLRLLQQVHDPYTLALALVNSASVRPAGSVLSQAALSELSSIKARFLEKSSAKL